MQGAVKVIHYAAQCRAVVTASRVDCFNFRGKSPRVTFTWTRTTRMIQVQAGAAILDKVSDKIEQLARSYLKGLLEARPQPAPDGCGRLADALEYPPVHSYGVEDKTGKGAEGRGRARTNASTRKKSSVLTSHTTPSLKMAQSTTQPPTSEGVAAALSSARRTYPGRLHRASGRSSAQRSADPFDLRH